MDNSNKLNKTLIVTLIISILSNIWSILNRNVEFISTLSDIIITGIIRVMLEKMFSVTIKLKPKYI